MAVVKRTRSSHENHPLEGGSGAPGSAYRAWGLLGGTWGTSHPRPSAGASVCFCFYLTSRQGNFGVRFHLERKAESVLT